MAVSRLAAVAASLGAAAVLALDNGLGLVPPRGFSSWNAFSSNVTSAKMRNITRIVIESGLAAKGCE